MHIEICLVWHIFPSKACICTDKSVQGWWSVVIWFSSKIYWVVDTIFCSALSGWGRTSSLPLPWGHLTGAGWWGRSPVHAVPWALHSRCRQGGCSWARANTVPRSVPATKPDCAALACCPRQCLCPTSLTRVGRTLCDYKDVLRWVISMGCGHKVLKLVLKTSQWHSCLSQWRGASWICHSKKYKVLEEKHESAQYVKFAVFRS